MALDLMPFHRAVAQLAAGLAAARAAPGDELMRDGVIQRFKCTYGSGHDALRRCLGEPGAARERQGAPDLPGLIRLGAGRGLLPPDRGTWSGHHEARARADLGYDRAEAEAVFERVPAFLDDAQRLLAALERRTATAPPP